MKKGLRKRKKKRKRRIKPKHKMALTILFIIIILIALALGGYAALLHVKKKEIPLDYSIIHNYLSQYTSGFFEGVIIEELKGKQRDGIIFIPRDIDHMKMYRDKKIKEVPQQIIWYDKNKRIDLPRGTLSAGRNIVIIQPKNPEDYNEHFKNTELGKLMIENTAEKNNESTTVEVLRIKSDRIKETAKKLGGGEPISTEFLDFLQKAQQNALDVVIKEKEKSKIGDSAYHEPGKL